MTKQIRVRFAPSPTGPLHIGGIRTALYNYIFAKQNKGKFILRIEDTDVNRYIKGAEEYIKRSLNWLNIIPDEGILEKGSYGPYKQSKRISIYKKYIMKLIDEGKAYYAFDSHHELENIRNNNKNFFYNKYNRNNLKNSISLSNTETLKLIKTNNYVIRFKNDQIKDIEIDDLIKGKIKINSDTIEDKILLKSDGMPTYHFANIIDDHLMKISHVIRGEEWLPSCALHILLYKSFDWEIPKFAHLPLILNPNGKGKLSKRDSIKYKIPIIPLQWKYDKDDSLLKGFLEEGYLPETLINILALTGWNPGNNKNEFMTLKEIIKNFNINNVSKSGSIFPIDKCKSFNAKFIQTKTDNEIYDIYKKTLTDYGIEYDYKRDIKIISLSKKRVKFIKEIYIDNTYMYTDPIYNIDLINSYSTQENINIINEIYNYFAKLEYSHITEDDINLLCKQKNILINNLNKLMRLALVGELKGLPIVNIINIIGLEKFLDRINKFKTALIKLLK